MYLVATSKGIYKITGKEEIELVCCEGESMYDFILKGGRLYTCSSSNGVTIDNRNVIDESCWRLYEFGDKIIASVEGPRLYLVDEGKKILDLEDEGKKLGWKFLNSKAHITDFAVYKNKIIASVEDGHLLVGDELSSLKPIKFFADSHNLLSKGNYLYITTADGLYVTQDLENFHVIEKGYFHGIEDLGELILAQVRSKRPLFLGKEYKWERLNLELPSPTFGVTAISKIDNENIVYSTSSLVEINLKKLEAKTLIKNLPMTRRVKVVDH
ncbi:hypothetical protein [Sulfolobus acidocaldarius]|uniref:Uncharacterized protein n=3 Tax=Sulfolobus acidocaldarius TaxID=2285 RepID=M1J1B2_9CREN|nr:hypothetical protein [Sulfolobus acidocaldarius]AGE71018.1 hypothetical protein SacN8_05235 [Sulfolobus acidocaldarius N8]AGE73289.1 hypothetical protein SacRon12I_05225 [Sulfolobus acidocaldarius Ron12/I]ALU31404.1 hypothetical protein ATZ20_04120 [Sulfolobus acidocaldarius]WCM34971.1 hypothetical protein GO597_06285 [Sulfolobus acidocaldarius DSM 639]